MNATGPVGQPRLPRNAGLDALLQELMLERFSPRPLPATTDYPPVIKSLVDLSTGTRSSVSKVEDQVHPEITNRTPRRSR